MKQWLRIWPCSAASSSRRCCRRASEGFSLELLGTESIQPLLVIVKDLLRQSVHPTKTRLQPFPAADERVHLFQRWRKGEIIGAGAYGRVYMGMSVDSGELLAVKQMLITVNNVTKEKAQAHIRELEEEVRLLHNLSHPNIVVIRMYTKQLLLGLEYLHNNNILHRDIKGDT